MPDHRIEAVGGRINEAVVEFEIQRDLGMGGEERIERRAEMQDSEAHRRGQSQGSSQRTPPFRDLADRLFRIAQQAPPACQKRQTVLRQRELARRSLQQPRSQAAFELGEALADDGFRQPHAPSRRSDRTRLGYRNEGGDTVQLEHCSSFPEVSFAIRRL